MATTPAKIIKPVNNPVDNRDYEIFIECPEFTCLCPMTAQPDFAKINFTYIPDKSIAELKSLKLYLWSYRDKGIFHEKAVNEILDDFVKYIDPKYIKIEGIFNVRGGIYTTVTAEHKKES